MKSKSLLPLILPVALAGLTSLAAAQEVTPPASGVTASTSDTNLPGNTVDNNLGTRWSGNGDGAWIQFNLGSAQTIDRVAVAVYQGNARRNRFDIQVSGNGSTWTTVLSGLQTTGTTTAEESFTFAAQPAQYVRYVGHGATIVSTGAASSWNSVTEVSLFAAAGTPPTPTPTPTPPSSGTNLALNKPATASSVEGVGLEAAKAVDGSLTTRWASVEGVDPQWIQVDLVGPASELVQVNRVVLRWEAAYASAYRVEVSNDGASWNTVHTQTGGDGGVDDLTITAAARTGRYVRVFGTTRATAFGYSLFEVEVYGQRIAVDPTPTPSPTPVGPTPTPTATPMTPVPPTPTPTPTATPAAGHVDITPGASGVTASTNDGNLPGNTVDNSLATRWSANGDGHWIKYDLGATHTVGYVRLAFYSGNTRQSRFDLQVSTDNATWTNVLTNALSSGTTTNEQQFEFTDAPGRYVRYLGHGNTANMWNSLTEVNIFGSACTTCPTPPPATPTPTPTSTPVAPTPTPTPTPPAPGTGVVGINGQLRVCGTKLCNQYGNPIQLRGMSTHGLQWYPGCIDNTAAADALVNDWKADVLRVSMYVQEGGYETNPSGFTTLADRIIDRAIARNMYVVIDWHMLSPGDPMYNLSRAQTYFTHMAQRYGTRPHVIYEIANEPNGVSWARIKEYANAIIPTIRNIDPDGVILIGTRAWSSLGVSDGSGPSEVINSPVAGTNLMYVFHMYAASHGSSYLNALSTAANSIPMFVTEWGTQTASGDGGNNFTMSQQYVDLMRTKQISWVNWNWSDDSRSGAVFTAGTCPGGPYAGTTRLKQAGVWIRERILSPADSFPTN